MSLKNILGQEKAVEILLGIIRRQKIATTYLFSGDAGIGKKLTALNFAKALNCQRSWLDSESAAENLLIDACDICDSCEKIDSAAHPDLLLVEPEERQIRIDEIRMVDEVLSLKPFEARLKIVIVDDADTMNISAANAFLKTLEEPPESSVIILISSNPDRLPDTIRSRCSRISFKPLSSELCMQVLRSKLPDSDIESLARLSMGRPGIALASDYSEEKKWFLNLLGSMLNAERDSWASRDEMERWFDLLLALLRDMAVLKITGDPSKLMNTDIHEYIDKLSTFVELKVIICLYAEIIKLKNLLIFNLNKSVIWNYTGSLVRKELAR